MTIPSALLQEIEVLKLFNPASTLEGVKIHHSAAQQSIDAMERLFNKELVSLPDGGYLTSLGQEAVRHLDNLVTILSSD